MGTAVLLHLQGGEEALLDLCGHLNGGLLTQLRQAVLDHVVDVEVDVARLHLLVAHAAHRLRDEVRLGRDELAHVLDRLPVQLYNLGHFKF